MEYTHTFKHTDNITLKPCELNDPYYNIEYKLNKKINSCSEDNGFIIDIKNINIISNIISRSSGNIIFQVIYDIVTLIPKIDHVYTGCIDRIFKEGVWVNFNGIKILVPYTFLNDWTYKNNTFVLNDRIISPGDWIKVLIKGVLYEEHTYKCIGSII